MSIFPTAYTKQKLQTEIINENKVPKKIKKLQNKTNKQNVDNNKEKKSKVK